jgi:GTPase
MIYGTIAIVGAPNVGKSSIFNRFVGTRTAIVDDIPGLTRDRIYGQATWLSRDFKVIDTGGIESVNRPYQQQIKDQVTIAITEADVILFVVDGKLGITRDDEAVAKILYSANKPVILCVNKIDDVTSTGDIAPFYALGFNDPIAISSAHGIGIGDLLDQIIQLLPKPKDEQYDNHICFSIIGRPNVGKSSLVNAILNQERVIVSEMEGTTRDAIDTFFKRNDRDYVVIDTAGLRKRGKRYEAIEKYSSLRALKAIDRSDVVLFVIDGKDGIREQDKHVAGYAFEAKKAMIIVINKWDLAEKEKQTIIDFKKKIRHEFKFLDFAPITYVSALTKMRISTLFNTIDDAYNSYNARISTSALNDIIVEAQIINPTPDFNGGRLKIFYGSQVSERPPGFALFVNNPKYMHFSYQRYLENRLREVFPFEGTPIKFMLRKRR